MDTTVSPHRRRRYTTAEKLEILDFVQTNSAAAAQVEFGVSRSSISAWIKHEEEYKQLSRSVKRRPLLASSTQLTDTSQSSVEHVDLIFDQCLSTTSSTISSGPTDATASSTTTSDTPLPATIIATTSSIISSCPTATTDSATTASHTPVTAMDIASSSLPLDTRVTRRQNETEQFIETRVSEYDDSRSHGFHGEQILDRPLIIGFMGEGGGFPEIAARLIFDELNMVDPTLFTPFQLTGYPQVVHMLDALRQREIDYGFIATDTLFSQNCRVALDRVISSRFAIIGNIRIEETVCLCALPGVEVCSADCIMSNWQLLTRYEDFILELETASNQLIHRLVSWDSATACRIVREEQDGNTLVLCSDKAALAYGFNVIVGDVPCVNTSTKYIIIGRRGTHALPLDKLPGSDTRHHREGTLLIDNAEQSDVLFIVNMFERLNLKVESFSVFPNGIEPYRYVDEVGHINSRCFLTYL